jgi:UPF0755 protein
VQKMEAVHLTSNARQFLWMGKVFGHWRKIKAGEYELSPRMTPLEIFNVLVSGQSVIHPVTVHEGDNIYQLAVQFEEQKLMPKEKFLEYAVDATIISQLGFGNNPPPSLEGYLYPETYFFNRTMTPQEMITQMVRKFMSGWDEKKQKRAAELGWSRHQIVTLASVVEKETGAPHERPMIASAFFNRLKRKIRLQSDPTSIYGIWDKYNGNITRADLRNKNPYNTYVVDGIPFGPISNPGKAAIEAVLYPAESENIFFVSRNDGTHEFTATYKEHQRAVKKFQLDPKAREGKSWRDLEKKAK